MLIKLLLKLTMLIRTLFLLVSRLPSQVAQWVKNPLAMWEMRVQSLGGKISWRKDGNPLQYSCLENPHGQRNLVGYSP